MKLGDLNLRIGFPSNIEIEAGNEESIYVEVNDANSLVYIGFATTFNDISFHVLKFIQSDESENKNKNINKNNEILSSQENEYDENTTDKGHFKSLFKIEKIDSSIQPIKVKFFF